MGSGKSTSGPLIARTLGYDFVDLDAEVEAMAGRSVAEIFRTEGESSFRALEEAATRALAGRPRLVIAVGGGWGTRPGAVSALPSAVRVWLKARPDTLLARTAGHPEERPLLDPMDPMASIRVLMGERESSYAEAEVQIDTDELTPEEVAAEVTRRLKEADWSRQSPAG